MKIISDNTNGFDKVRLESADGVAIIISWSEFWEICREGARRETVSEVWDCISQCDELAGFNCADITELMVQEIADATIKTRVAKENSDDIYDAALTVLRQCMPKHALKVYNIGFVNDKGKDDETQFDAKDEAEALELFAVFCKENGFSGSWEYVEEVQPTDE